MTSTISPNPISISPQQGTNRDAASSDAGLGRVFEQLLDPDDAKVTVGVTSTIGEASVSVEGSEGNGWNVGGHAEIADEVHLGDQKGSAIGVKSGLGGREGTEIKGTLFGREAVGIMRRGDDGTKLETLEISFSREAAKTLPGRMLNKLPASARDLVRGPAGAVDADVKLTVTRQTSPDGEVTHYGGLKVEASPSETLELFGAIEELDAKAFVQVEGVLRDDENRFSGASLSSETGFSAVSPEQSLDTYGVMNPETRIGHHETVEVGMYDSVVVSEHGGMQGSLETVTPEAAAAMQRSARQEAALVHDAKAVSADSEPERFGHEAAAQALREGMPVRQASMFSKDVQTANREGDSRNADAMIEDYRDDRYINGSNLPEVTIGDRTYAVSNGGGEMHGRTTMTPGEIEARAHAHAAGGGDVASDALAKAKAAAMAQSLRDGFSTHDRIAIVDVESVPATREQDALNSMIAEAKKIEARKTEREGADIRQH